MEIAGILVGRRIEQPTKLPFSCFWRTSAAAAWTKTQRASGILRLRTDLLKELRQVSGGSDQTSAIRTMIIGPRMNGKDNAAL
jgi:hypothetical protein